MLSKNFIIVTYGFCLGYAKTFWIEVTAKLGSETR